MNDSSGASPTLPPTLSAGDMLGHLYRVVRPVGRGAQGDVYEVEHVHLGTRFAAKLLHPHLARDPGMVERFAREAKTASQLSHPHIARVVNFDRTQDGRTFAVMELLVGEDLGVRLRRGALSVGEAIQLTTDIGGALDAAHAAGVVHRDLKPSNLFLARDGDRTQVKLTDFGISKVVRDAEDLTRLTDTGAVVGTPLYMAPEQATGEAIDHRVDVYALGVVLFEMLAARPPFRATKAHELLVEKTFMDPPQPRTLLPDLAPEIADVLGRALAKRPADRFGSVRDMIAALHAAAQRGGHAPDQVVTVEMPPPLSETDYARATRPRPAPGGGGRFAAIGALVGVALAVAAFLWTRPPTEAPAVDAAVAAAPPAADAGPTVARARLVTEPPGAEVTGPDGRSRGRTPLEVELREAGDWQIAAGARRTTLRLDPEAHRGQTVRVVLPAPPPEAPRPRPRGRRRPKPEKAPDRAPQPLEITID